MVLILCEGVPCVCVCVFVCVCVTSAEPLLPAGRWRVGVLVRPAALACWRGPKRRWAG